MDDVCAGDMTTRWEKQIIVAYALQFYTHFYVTVPAVA